MWHFWVAMLMGYGLTAVGVLGGLRLIDAHSGRTPWALKVSLPVMLVAVLAWQVILGVGSGFFRTLPETATVILQFAFLPVAAAAAGVFLVLRQPGENHKRGTLLMNVLRRRRPKPRPGQLTLADHPVPEADETKQNAAISFSIPSTSARRDGICSLRLFSSMTQIRLLER
jgi:hypothetical protein